MANFGLKKEEKAMTNLEIFLLSLISIDLFVRAVRTYRRIDRHNRELARNRASGRRDFRWHTLPEVKK